MVAIKLMLRFGTKSWLHKNKEDKHKVAQHSRQELPNLHPDTPLPVAECRQCRHHLDCMIA
jgi:hypothetical protein